jgi:tRNA G18 (ribose-2'-O)-methylase SpoU
MARLVRVDDASDSRLADYVSLRDVQLRKRLEVDRGVFVAEGEKVVRRAVAAGHRVLSFLMAERWLDSLRDELAATGDVPCYVVDDAVAEQVTGFHVHRGALAVLQRPLLRSVEEVVAGARRVVVLEDIVDHTNVGAVFRSAAALGVDALLLSPRCADPLYRRSVKVAMGAVFAVPWTRLPTWYDALPALSADGFTTVALTPAGDAMELACLSERVAGRRLALVIGGEGHGLSARWLSAADLRVAIPMANGIDSLNVAAAAAIACYATRSPAHSASAPPPTRSRMRSRPM